MQVQPEIASPKVMFGVPSVEQRIALKQLRVPAYQRDFNLTWAQTIARNFDGKRFLKPKVAKIPNGTYTVIDGQHRIAALRIKYPQDDSLVVLCDVHDLSTQEEGANAFLDCNVHVKAVGPGSKFRARLQALDPTALSLQKIANEKGFQIKQTNLRNLQPGELTPSSLLSLITNFGGSNFALVSELLDVAIASFDITEVILFPRFVTGLGSFIGNYQNHPNYHRQQLVDVLSYTNPEAIRRQSLTLRAALGGGDDACVRQSILLRYNKPQKPHLPSLVGWKDIEGSGSYVE